MCLRTLNYSILILDFVLYSLTHEDSFPAISRYYRNWDKIDVDTIEKKLDEDFQKQDEAEAAEKERIMKENQEKQKAINEHGFWGKSGKDESVDFTNEDDFGISNEELKRISAVQRNHLCDQEKGKGNEAFYAQDLEEAEMYYGRALRYACDKTQIPACASNRALVRLKLKRYDDCVSDCDIALRIDPAHPKSLHRRGKANYELGR
jgi:tetratricopeptide (TPR) repeat protein